MPEPRYQVREIEISGMKPGANVRSQVHDDEIIALGESLKERQYHPLILTPDHTILDGWRRWLAAKRAGISKLWAVITHEPLSDEERITAQVVMSLHRAGLSDQEKTRACEDLLALEPDLDQRQLAAKLQVDAATVSRWLSPSAGRVIPEVREAFLGSDASGSRIAR